MIRAALLALTLALPASAQTPMESSMGALIERLEEDLDGIAETLRSRESAPDTAFIGRDKNDYTERLNGYLDEAFGLVAPDLHDEYRRRLDVIEESIAEGDAVRPGLMIDRLSAPEEGSGPTLMDRALGREHARGSREEIDQQITEIDEARAALVAERDALIAEFAGRLNAEYGLDVTSEQARAALTQVDGAMMVEAAIAMRVLGAMEERLREITEGGLDPAVANRYYGVAAISRLLVARMYERHLQDYDETWLPRLAEMRADHDRLMADTRAKMRVADGNLRRQYQANLAVQERVLAALRAYGDVLARQRAATAQGLGGAVERADLALNTLRTLESAVVLSNVMSETMGEFEALTGLGMAPLLPLDDEEIFEQYLGISRALEAGS